MHPDISMYHFYDNGLKIELFDAGATKKDNPYQ